MLCSTSTGRTSLRGDSIGLARSARRAFPREPWRILRSAGAARYVVTCFACVVGIVVPTATKLVLIDFVITTLVALSDSVTAGHSEWRSAGERGLWW